MSATFDSTTKAAYDAAITAQARAEAVVASLTGTISVKVFNGSNTEMGSGTMADPWAAATAGSVVLGEVASFTVGTTATPDADWYIRFQNADVSRWARGSFGLSGSGQDFTWSLDAWTATDTGTIGTATIVCAGNAAPVFTVAPTTAYLSGAGGTIQFTASDPDGGSVFYSLTTTRAGITIDSVGLVTVTSAAAGTSGNIVVQASDGILTASATCSVVVEVAPVGRSGLIKTIDFSQFSANVTAPTQVEQSSFDVGGSVTVALNAANIRHIGQSGETFSAAAAAAGYQSLAHLEIISSSPTPPNGGRCARTTLYYAAVDYTTGAYQPNDKPRVDWYMRGDELGLLRDGEYWLGLAVWLPADYVIETAGVQETLIQFHANQPGHGESATNTNHAEFVLDSSWRFQGDNVAGNGNAWLLSTPITSAHLGQWNYIVLNWRAGAVSNSPFGKFWLNGALVGQSTGVAFGATDFEWASMSMNYYKGGWRNGVYAGNKSGTTVVCLSDFRIGSSLSDYTSVHPLTAEQP